MKLDIIEKDAVPVPAAVVPSPQKPPSSIHFSAVSPRGSNNNSQQHQQHAIGGSIASNVSPLKRSRSGSSDSPSPKKKNSSSILGKPSSDLFAKLSNVAAAQQYSGSPGNGNAPLSKQRPSSSLQ